MSADILKNDISESPQTYWQAVWLHFKRKRLAVIGLWVTLFLFVTAIFAPILANEKPIAYRYQGQWYWPIFSGAEKVGPDSWKDMKKDLPFILQTNIGGRDDLSIWPPVPYSPSEYNLLEILEAPSGRHIAGTDDR
ncbi:MAG: hypothetical protein ACLGPL_06925, partial [Acidobacteriota bacterium]